MSIQNDAIDALVALGHKQAEAKRLVAEAMARGADASDVQSIIEFAYAKPAESSSPYADAYGEYYRGSANLGGEHSELLQVAQAVGPGLSESEFEALAKQVEDLQAKRYQFTNRGYQAALWAIPEAFAAQRKAPVHFQPQRDKSGKPVETAIEPIPPKSIEGMSAAERPAAIPPDAIKSVLKPEPTAQAATAQEMGAMVRGAGSGAVNAMYEGLWTRVQAGETSEAGQKSALLQAAKLVRDRGGMQSIEDLRAMAKDYGNIERGADFQQQMRQLVEKHLANVKSVPAAPSASAMAGMMGKPAAAETFRIGDSVVTQGKSGPVAGAIKGTTLTGNYVIDTPHGSVARSRDKLEHYRPTFNAGDAVHLPRYAADSGGMGKVIAKNPDGTFSVNINGRELGSVPAGDMQSPDGLEKTPREQSPFSFAGAEQGPDVGATLSGLLNQPAPEESKTGTAGNTLDKAQMIADAVGVVDQTGITDLANAGVSLTRAVTDPDRAGEHLANAGMRAISAIPVVGDVAKLAKYGAKGAEAARGGKAAHHLLKGGAESQAKAGGRFFFGSGVDAAAQAALRMVRGGGGSGGGGNGGLPPTGDSGDAADPEKIGEDSKQAARDIKTLGESIEKFLNNTGAAGAALAHIGNEVYQRALKPLIDWFKQIDSTSKAMLEDNRKLAAYSGEISAAMQRLDTSRFLRDVARAQDMSGSISRLAGAQGRSEQAQQDLTQPYRQLGVELQTLRTELVARVTKMVDSIDVIGNLLDWWFNREPDQGARTPAERAANMFDEFLAERQL